MNNYYTVQLLQDEIIKLSEEYKTSDYIKGIEEYIPSNQFVKDDLIEGLWYYFAIYELSSRNAYTITAYEENFLTLEKIIEDKIWLYQNWSKDTMFHQFNDFIFENIKLKKLRDLWKVESELQSFANSGIRYITKLHNDEKIKLYKQLMTYADEKEINIQDYQNRIKELELKNSKLELSKIKYKDIYERIAVLRKENNKITENIRITINEFKGKHTDLDKLFADKNGIFGEVVEHLRRLFYNSKYYKL